MSVPGHERMYRVIHVEFPLLASKFNREKALRYPSPITTPTLSRRPLLRWSYMRLREGVLFDRCVRLGIVLTGARREDGSRSAMVSAFQFPIGDRPTSVDFKGIWNAQYR